MLPRLVVGVVVGLFLFGVLAVGGSQGLTEAVDVVVLIDRPAAEFGEAVNVTVYVFDRGVPAEPSEISGVVDRLPGLTPLALHRQSVGVFTGEFVFESHPSLVVVNATVGTVTDSGRAVVSKRYSQVTLVPSVSVASPGQPISLVVENRDGYGVLREADFVNATATVITSSDLWPRPTPASLAVTRSGTGRYMASYTVPATIEQDAVVEFRADVVGRSYGSGAGAWVFVDAADSFQVWYRTLAIVGSNATLEIDVASMDGAPVTDAAVSLRAGPFDGSMFRESTGVTNSSGAVQFDVPFREFGLHFTGNVTSALQRQEFTGDVAAPPASEPGKVEIRRENADEPFEAGENAVLRFRLVRGEIPIPNQELFVYAHTRFDLVLAEQLQTDAEGRFEIRFVAPPHSVVIDVGGSIEGTWTSLPTIVFSAVNRLSATVRSPDGWHVTITGRFPASPEPWLAYLQLAAKSSGLPGTRIASGAFGLHQIVGGSGGQPFTFEVTLPRFLPAGEAVSISIWARSFRGGYHQFLATVVAGTPVLQPIDLTLLVPIVILGVVIALAVLGPRRRPPRPDRIPPDTSSGGRD